MNDEMIDEIAPLAERMRPEEIEDMVGQPHLLGPEASFRKALESGRVGGAAIDIQKPIGFTHD